MATRLAQHPPADGHDEPGLLGHGNELGGRRGISSAIAVASTRPPTQQGFGADEPPIVEEDLGLVGERELLVVDGLAQRGLRLEAGDGSCPHGGVEQLIAGPAPLLGAVHGRVGVTQQALRTLAGVGGEGHADAHGHDQIAAGEGDRR